MSLIKDLPEELKPIAGECIGLRQANALMIDRLERNGVNIETTDARLEHFTQALVEAGVLTLETLWQINLGWEKNLNAQLHKAQEQTAAMMDRQRQAAEQQRAAVEKTLAVPQGPRLIVPGRD